MEILMVLFGSFVLASIVALIKFEGNPLFAFSLLLSATSLIWLISLARHEGKEANRSKQGRKPRK